MGLRRGGHNCRHLVREVLTRPSREKIDALRETISLNTLTSAEREDALQTLDALLEESDPSVNGNIDSVLVLDNDRLLLRIADRASDGLQIASTRLQVYSRTTRALVAPAWVTVSEWTLTEPLLAREGKVYVGDRGHLMRPSGLRIFNSTTGAEETSTPIDVGQEPYQLVERPTL